MMRGIGVCHVPLASMSVLGCGIFFHRKKITNRVNASSVNGLGDFLDDQTPKARLARAIAASLGSSHFNDNMDGLLHLKTSHERSLQEVR